MPTDNIHGIPIQPGDTIAGWQVIRTLGTGGEATVQKWRRGSNHTTVVAAKIVRVTYDPRTVRHEYAVLRQLAAVAAANGTRPCPYVIRARDYLRVRLRGGTALGITLLDFCDGGSVADAAWRSREARGGGGAGPHELDVWNVAAQAAAGLTFVHACGFVHRDIKLENLLLEMRATGPDFPRVKICDFGLAARAESGGWMERGVGTLGFSAPEYPLWTPKADVWALGASVHYLCANVLPEPVARDGAEWRLVDISAPLSARRSLPYSARHPSVKEYSYELNRIMHSMLEVDDRRRPDSAVTVTIIQSLWERRKRGAIPGSRLHRDVRDLDQIIQSLVL
jgi:serine/threonine protein kinase